MTIEQIIEIGEKELENYPKCSDQWLIIMEQLEFIKEREYQKCVKHYTE